MNKDAAPLRLRTGTYDDIPDVLMLWREAGTAPSTTDDADGLNLLLSAAPSALLIAEYQGQIVGTLVASFDGWRGNLVPAGGSASASSPRRGPIPSHRGRASPPIRWCEAHHRASCPRTRWRRRVLDGSRLRPRSARDQVRQDVSSYAHEHVPMCRSAPQSSRLRSNVRCVCYGARTGGRLRQVEPARWRVAPERSQRLTCDSRRLLEPERW
jgi:hypothetical protein